MISKRFIEFMVGVFIIAGIAAVFLLALKVSGLSNYSTRSSYEVVAVFDNVGDLKVRAPVSIAGVRIGEVSAIRIDNKNFKAEVTLLIDKKYDNLPIDSSAKILTAGLIGGNYIELLPGFDTQYLINGSKITDTQPAIILENLIGQIIYRVQNKK